MEKIASVLIACAGLLGAGGVAAGAAAAHTSGGGPLETASHYALIHAAAIVGLALNARNSRLFLAAAGILALGALLFSGDLALRALAGAKLFPMAAPAGGMLLILGWLTVTSGAVAALIRRNAIG